VRPGFGPPAEPAASSQARWRHGGCRSAGVACNFSQATAAPLWPRHGKPAAQLSVRSVSQTLGFALRRPEPLQVVCDPPSEAFLATLFTGADNVVCTAHPAALSRGRSDVGPSSGRATTARHRRWELPDANLQRGFRKRGRIGAALAERTCSFRRPPGWRRSEHGGRRAKCASRAHLCAKSKSKHQRRMRWLTSSRS
jgi:hypothetical protein